MKKLAFLVAILAIQSQAQAAETTVEHEADLPTITVVGEKIENISGTDVKSADLAEALSKRTASISLVRRSGIANDIILRGQKKDNINVLIDGAKVYGACPNRMDPPTSHIITNNIESVEIIEGPYDVENFGTLSGSVIITTSEPEEGIHGEVSLHVGSWNYLKGSATLSGGSDRVKAMASISKESSDQYEDGDGNNFAEQIENFGNPMARYQPKYEDMDAYDKETFMGKLYVDVTDNQQLKLSYTANRSDDVLYPSSKMDALYDDSDIFTADYSIQDLAAYSKSLDISYYDSKVEHPMSTRYRMSSGPDSMNERVSYLESSIRGLQIKNAFDIDADTELAIGVDGSTRNWDGTYTGYGMSAGITGIKSIDDVDTDNAAIFAELDKDFNNFNLKLGARYDDTSIDPGTGSLESNDYNSFSAFAFGTWQMDAATKLFGGLGQSHRVPDARELYFRAAMGPKGMLIGTPDLDQVRNNEIDFGMENSFDGLYLKTKVFYSWLDDFILYNDSKKMQKFENVDATIYGISMNGSWNITEVIYLDFGLAYQRGEKDNALTGQTDKDLPEIPPLKANLALNWDYMDNSTARAEVIASDDWSRFDEDNGEQHLDSWAVLNLKVHHQFTDSISITGGVDNVFDETYAVSNTYKDLTLLLDGVGDVMLMNEPGRYFYLNAGYRF